MKKTIRLTESDLIKLIKRVINEEIQQFRLFDLESHNLVDKIYVYEVNKMGESLSFKYSKSNGDSNQSGEFDCPTGEVKLFQDDKKYYFSLEGSKYFGEYCRQG